MAQVRTHTKAPHEDIIPVSQTKLATLPEFPPARLDNSPLHFAFAEERERSSFVVSLLSLFDAVSSDICLTFAAGHRRNNLFLEEMSGPIRGGLVSGAKLQVVLGGVKAELKLELMGNAELLFLLPLSEQRGQERLWLQCSPQHISPLPTLTLPMNPGSFCIEACHGFVALARQSGGFLSASLPQHQQRWDGDATEDGQPLSSIPQTALYLPTEQPLPEGHQLWWFSEGDISYGTPAATDSWWRTFDELLAAPKASLPELKHHLNAVFDIRFPWKVVEKELHSPCVFMTTSTNDVVGVIVPLPSTLEIGIDVGLPSEQLGPLLLHLCAHCELGHIAPGDPYGHWDSLETALSSQQRREWDLDATSILRERFARATQRKVSSLEECNPLEKAWLVLYEHIGQMVGQARALHPRAEEYQSAAYQRQAAQRIVSQLELYGGSMLCDGVGLGKTYVATTTIVHYANVWLEGNDGVQDPFRITILAPNSVVSTWRREAIPPLASHGVQTATIRVISHTKLSRVSPSSGILREQNGRSPDMEHLLLSDLVIVDEAHNFRSLFAKRTVVLRDLLRLQPRKNQRRKTLLLTATPINNSLDDLRQQLSLLFSKPLWLNDKVKPKTYREHAIKDIRERIVKAIKSKKADVAEVLFCTPANPKFSQAIDFRDDIDFGEQVPRVGDYLKEQEKKLQEYQEKVRAAMRSESQREELEPLRVASELLDRIVVQRSRHLCKQIEREQRSNLKLLFRPDAPPPGRLVYEDMYGDTSNMLAQFLHLFDTVEQESGSMPLSLKIYMWFDVKYDIKGADETSSVVGLQRVLVLKRLESSPVAFLITILRLLALHAYRLQELKKLASALRDRHRSSQLNKALDDIVSSLGADEKNCVRFLLLGDADTDRGKFLQELSQAHNSKRSVSEIDDLPAQYDFFAPPEPIEVSKHEQLRRLWELKDDLLQDFVTLLQVAPRLAEIVFRYIPNEGWPSPLVAGGSGIDWPVSSTWGMRLVSDAKLRALVQQLLRAQRDGQKVVVFSQFTDTLAYIQSVLHATSAFGEDEWESVLERLSEDESPLVTRDALERLVAHTTVVSGETEDRDSVINAFAPFYRLGPFRPMSSQQHVSLLDDIEAETPWIQGWTQAMLEPIDVLLASDVLAEGVNLQDAATLINYDIHWNPVRMIQRAGRVDRRLNPAIEEAESFPDLEELAATLQVPAPQYWWHEHRDAAPQTLNLLLPDELEDELQLREKIANKTLAIDFTLGLERGTGAEAEWMADYRYQGISALNAWQQDRAIERVAGYQERLHRVMSEREIQPEWVHQWNGWIRELDATEDCPILAWAHMGRKGGEIASYSRYLKPFLNEDVLHWLWTTAKPGDSPLLNFWLVLDGQKYPAATRKGLGWHEDASRPFAATDLLGAAIYLVEGAPKLEELGREIGRPLMQGCPAISAGFLSSEAERRHIALKGFRLLQLSTFELPAPKSIGIVRRGIARACSECGHPPGMHKCCPSCQCRADGEARIDAIFGFRKLRASDGTPYEVPQTWCKNCRRQHKRKEAK